MVIKRKHKKILAKQTIIHSQLYVLGAVVKYPALDKVVMKGTVEQPDCDLGWETL